MAVLSFDINQVRELAKHAAESAEHSPTFSQHFEKAFWKEGTGKLTDDEIFSKRGEHLDLSKIPAGLWLVKDSGIYLMSNGNPGLKREDGQRNVVCYAKGYNPSVDEDYYDKARAAVGGDDFAEFIPLAWFEETEKAGRKVMSIRMNKTSMSLKV